MKLTRNSILWTYYALHTTIHRHTTIVTNETVVNSSVGSCSPSSDRAINHTMSLMCGKPQGMVTHKPMLAFKNLTDA